MGPGERDILRSLPNFSVGASKATRIRLACYGRSDVKPETIDENGQKVSLEKHRSTVEIRRVIAALLGVRFSSLSGQRKRYGSGSKMHGQVGFSLLFYHEKKWGT